MGARESKMARIDTDYESLEAQRREALARQDADDYAHLCIYLGVEPEDTFLFERAGAESALREFNERKDLEGVVNHLENQVPRRQRRKADPTHYQKFLQDVYRCNYSDFERDTDYQIKTLQFHFPKRFGVDGKQDLRKYNGVQIGALFNDLVSNAEKIVRKSKKER